MPTFDDPRTDAAEAAEALRGLAHATRTFDNPADTYPAIGDLLAGVRSLRQVLDQLATAHLAHGNHAFDDNGSHAAGLTDAFAAADELHQAGTLLDQAEARVNAAFSHSGRITWHTDPAVTHEATAPERIPDESLQQQATQETGDRRWISVVFLQGEEADEVLDLIDHDGPYAAIDHLAQWDYGDETVDAALENGYVYDQPPTSLMDRTAEAGDYALAYNPFLGHVALSKQTVIARDPSLDDAGLDDAQVEQARTATSNRAPAGPSPSSVRESASRHPAATEQDWFGVGPRTATGQRRGLSL